MLLRFELSVADAEFRAPIPHQVPQVANTQAAHLMHADQQRRVNRQPAVDRHRTFAG